MVNMDYTKFRANLVTGRKSFWLVFGRHPATISSASPNTPTDVLRTFLQPIWRMARRYLDYANIALEN